MWSFGGCGLLYDHVAEELPGLAPPERMPDQSGGGRLSALQGAAASSAAAAPASQHGLTSAAQLFLEQIDCNVTVVSNRVRGTGEDG